jgi:hypothetical protein
VELQDQLTRTPFRFEAPVYVCGSWLIRGDVEGFRITVECAPNLGLLGLASGTKDVEEIYRGVSEVVARLHGLAENRVIAPGTISQAAYTWSKHELGRLPPGTPDRDEHLAIVQTFEALHKP